MLGPQEGDVQLGVLDSELIFKGENSHLGIFVGGRNGTTMFAL